MKIDQIFELDHISFWDVSLELDHFLFFGKIQHSYFIISSTPSSISLYLNFLNMYFLISVPIINAPTLMERKESNMLICIYDNCEHLIQC